MNHEPDNRMGARPPARFWRRARIAFRWMRIALLGVALFAVAVLLWCNYVGVPAALASLLRAELRRKNLDVDFERLRLEGISKLVARDLHFASASSNQAPQLQAASAEVILDPAGLRRGEIEVAGLRLHRGRLAVPIHRINEEPRFLVISNVVADIDLLAGDALRVSRVSGEAFGARAEASGLLRHFSRLSMSRRGAAQGGSARWREELREIADAVSQFEFEEKPKVSLQVSGDASNPASIRASLNIAVRSARSQWGSFERLRLASGVFPAASNSAITGEFSLSLGGLKTDFGAIREAGLEARSVWSASLDQLITNRLSLNLSGAESQWGNAEVCSALVTSGARGDKIASEVAASLSGFLAGKHSVGPTEFEASVAHSLPIPSPAAWFRRFIGQAVSPWDTSVDGHWALRSSTVALPRARLDALQLSGGIQSQSLRPHEDASLGPWRHAAGLRFPWSLAISNMVSDELSIGTLRAAGLWSFPEFRVIDFDAQLYRGAIAGTAGLDVKSREFRAGLQGDFDYHSIARLLDKPVQKWLEQFSWERPPFIDAQVQFVAPEWTNSWADARRDILAGVLVHGSFKGAAKFRDFAVEHAESRFIYSNFVWRLPDLTVTRPEGITLVDYSGNVTNGTFRCWVDARLDPGAFRSFADKKAHMAFDLVQFSEPLVLTGFASGDWDHPEQIHFSGRMAATNFFVRKRLVDDVSGDISFSNLVLEAWAVTAHLGTGTVRAPYLRVDIPEEVMFVTNVISTANPYDAMYMVGPEAYDAIDPYRFAIPPTVRVNGNVPLRKVSKADLWFDVAGEQFSFWKFGLPHLSGLVHWRAQELWITNVHASFYKGRANWEGYFLIHDGEDRADFRFTGQATNAELKLLVADLFGMTNRMEGLFSGSLVITSADTANDKSWNGYGEASLKDGFLWDVPVFGVLTPMLDALVPGASVSRVTAGAGQFQITNSVVHTKDLQVRTRAFRLNYEGSVDLEGRLDAVVVAEIFRDTWLVGRVFSLALWPVAKAFEAKISGNASSPKTQLRYFPKFLLAPFRAIGALAGSAKPEENSAKQPESKGAPQ